MQLILDVSPSITEPKTGIGVLLENLVGVLKKMEDLTLKFFALTPIRSAAKLKEKYPGISLFPVPARWLSHALGVIQALHVPMELFTGSADAVLSLDWLCLPLRSGITVALIADATPLVDPDWYTPEQIRWFTNRLTNIEKHADIVLAISHATKEELVARTSIPKKKIIVAYPGLPQFFKKRPRDQTMKRVQRKYHLPASFLLHVGNTTPRKNVERLIGAFGTVKPGIRGNTLLVVVGNLKEQQKFDRPFVKNLGYLPESELPSLYRLSKGLVYPSLMEGFGFPILEAFASNIPVLTSRISSMEEIARGSAILVDPTNTASLREGLETLLMLDTRERTRLTRQGRERLQRMTYEGMVDTMIKAIKGK